MKNWLKKLFKPGLSDDQPPPVAGQLLRSGEIIQEGDYLTAKSNGDPFDKNTFGWLRVGPKHWFLGRPYKDDYYCWYFRGPPPGVIAHKEIDTPNVSR